MLVLEHLTNKFQELLGAQYAVYANDAFQREYTQPMRSPMGDSYDINYQAFEEYKDKIIAVVSFAETNPISSSYRVVQGNYTLQFWVPLNFYKSQSEGLRFNFYGDAETLINSIKNTEIAFTETDGSNAVTTYRAYMSITEPTLLSSTIDHSGAYSRAVYQMTGSIAFSDIDVAMGADMKVLINGNEVPDIFNVSIGATTSANQIDKQGTARSLQEVAELNYAIQFQIVEKYMVTQNAAIELIVNKAFENPEILSSSQSSAEKKRKVEVKVYKDKTANTPSKTFWATLSVEYSCASKTSLAYYTVTLMDTGE